MIDTLDESSLGPGAVEQPPEAIRLWRAGKVSAVVADAAGAHNVDSVVLCQLILFGYSIGARSSDANDMAAADRHLLRAGIYSDREENSTEFDGCRWSRLALALSRRCAEGAGIELTGGFDSRLNLALALAGGTPPRIAITIAPVANEEQDPDVWIARALCSRLGIEHRTLRPRIDPKRVEDDAIEFACRSGYASNACSYGWLPAVLREAALPMQITGAGGECCGGFFGGIPHWLGKGRAWRALVRRRLGVAGSLARSLFKDTRVFAEAVARLDAELTGGGSEREAALDQIYRRERVPNWAVPVLVASSAWYTPVAPLLSSVYQDWAATNARSNHRGRPGQRTLMAGLAPQVLELPFASDLRAGRTSRSVRALRAGMRRVLGIRRPRGDFMSGETAAALVRSDRTVEAIAEVARACDLEPSCVRRLLGEPTRFAHEIGALATCGYGLRGFGPIAMVSEGCDLIGRMVPGDGSAG